MPKIPRSHGSTRIGLAPGVIPASGTIERCPHSNMLFGKEIETGVSLNCFLCTPVRPREDGKPIRKAEVTA